MNALLALAVGAALTVAAVFRGALGDMAKQEAVTRFSQLPVWIIRLAARRVPSQPAELRETLTEEWQAEIDHIITRTRGLPLTRLARGTFWALGMLAAAKNVACELESADDAEQAVKRVERAREWLAAETVRLDPRGVRVIAFWVGTALVALLAALNVVPLNWGAQAFGLTDTATWLITGILLVASLGGMLALELELTSASAIRHVWLVVVAALTYAGLLLLRMQFLMAVARESLPTALLQAVLLTAVSAGLVLCGSAVMARTQHYRIAMAKAAAKRAERAVRRTYR